MNKKKTVVLNVRVTEEVADRLAVIGLGNKTKGVETAVMSFQGLSLPEKEQALPLKVIEDLADRIKEDVRFLEGMMAQVSQSIGKASERLSVSVSVTEQAFKEAVRKKLLPEVKDLRSTTTLT